VRPQTKLTAAASLGEAGLLCLERHRRHSYASFAKAGSLRQMDIALLMNHKLPGVMDGYIQETTLIEQLKGA